MQKDPGMKQIHKIPEFIKDKEVWGVMADITLLGDSFKKVFEVLGTHMIRLLLKKVIDARPY